MQNAFMALFYDLGMTPYTRQGLEQDTDTTPTDPTIGAPGGSRNHVAQAYGLSLTTQPHSNFLLFFDS
jgi:hypothetical protein